MHSVLSHKISKRCFEHKSVLNKSIHPCKSVNHTAKILTIYLLAEIRMMLCQSYKHATSKSYSYTRTRHT